MERSTAPLTFTMSGMSRRMQIAQAGPATRICMDSDLESGGVAALLGIAVLTAIGVFSKESAVVLPVVIVLYEVAFEKRWRRMWFGCAATLVPIGLMPCSFISASPRRICSDMFHCNWIRATGGHT